MMRTLIAASAIYALGVMTGFPVGACMAHEYSWRPFVGFGLADARTATAKTDMLGILSALDDYALNHDGTYPDSLELLVVPDENGERYLDGDAAPVDPWHRPYEYRRKTERTYVLLTRGADGAPGGAGEAVDIRSSDVKPRSAR